MLVHVAINGLNSMKIGISTAEENTRLANVLDIPVARQISCIDPVGVLSTTKWMILTWRPSALTAVGFKAPKNETNFTSVGRLDHTASSVDRPHQVESQAVFNPNLTKHEMQSNEAYPQQPQNRELGNPSATL